MMRTLIIFAREPVAGRAKTRLSPPLDPGTAAALYECLLLDTLDLARQASGVRTVIAYTPDSSPAYFARMAPDISAQAQRGRGLGERMDNALQHRLGQDRAEAHDQGAGAARGVVLIGSDLPHLPLARILDAFTLLEDGADVVFGPAEDGGYYLIGMRAPQPRLLRGVRMSTPTVLADTLEIARDLGLQVGLLPPWYDLDTLDDLRRLAADLRNAPATIAAHTRAFLHATLRL